ncbi:MAG: peptidoglycan editing factor PgeF [Ignavibacterium sp.]|jgi:YfiH family protein|nr:peptidoglycan editing factor PgeF [Ignavibacterium sp.]
MFILKPYIFNKFPELIFGFSTIISKNAKPPFYFNLSFSVGDDKIIVEQNRKEFLEQIGLTENSVSFQRQIHSDIIKTVNHSGDCGQSDALITNKTGLGLAVIIADCTPIFIYDNQNKVIAAVHAGWRGTEQNILGKTLYQLSKEFNSIPKDLNVYVGPSISQNNYEVGEEVAEKFEKKYLIRSDKKHLLDVSGANYDTLLEFGIPKVQIQRSVLCTFEYRELFHSYRRDGNLSGRSIGVIAIRD